MKEIYNALAVCGLCYIIYLALLGVVKPYNIPAWFFTNAAEFCPNKELISFKFELYPDIKCSDGLEREVFVTAITHNKP